jgi:hypothetical protein
MAGLDCSEAAAAGEGRAVEGPGEVAAEGAAEAWEAAQAATAAARRTPPARIRR